MQSKAAMDIASDAARDALAAFGLAHVRVWLADGDDTPTLAGTATAQSNVTYGGLREAFVAKMLAADPVLLPHAQRDDCDGALPTGAFLGTPLRSERGVHGYLECYADGALSFADAAKIEAWARELGAALSSLAATNELEAPARGHVLLADDDASIRRLLETLLTRNGFSVTAVANGLEACERAREVRPDLVLLDWMMPVLDGRSAAQRLKSDPATRHIPIVMLTSQSRTEDKVAALEAGAQDYLTKPFDSRELVARIEQQLRWRRLLADDPEPPPVATPAPTSHAAPVRDDGDGEPPTPADGDYWSAAVAAQNVGKLRHALAYYVREAEMQDRAKQFPRAAIAFRSASVVAGQLGNLDLANKLLRLSGKMYLCWAETSNDAKAMQDAYVNAARSFLSAGNLKLARKSVEIAESMHSVMADDRPSPLG
ncbi:MAG: response regulator [bacterium]|nr:response regulator [bacterium]